MLPDSVISAGELRQRINLMQQNTGQDSFGGVQVDANPTIFAAVWAKITALTGRELQAAQQQVSEVTHKIKMRWQRGITAAMTIQFDGRFFQIEGVIDPDERHVVLILLCIERGSSSRQSTGTAT